MDSFIRSFIYCNNNNWNHMCTDTYNEWLQRRNHDKMHPRNPGYS